MSRDDRAHGRHHAPSSKGRGHKGVRAMRNRPDLDKLRWEPPAWFLAKYPGQIKKSSS